MKTDPSASDICPIRSLRTRYITALLILAALSIIAFAGIEKVVSQGGEWGRIINVAGKQRMLSQRIAKEAERQDYQSLRVTLEEFEDAHAMLISGSEVDWREVDQSKTVERMFLELEVPYQAIVTAAHDLLNQDASETSLAELVSDIAQSESLYLPKMNAIVGQYEIEAKADNEMLVRIDFGVMSFTLLVLALEAFIVFEPAARKLKAQWTQSRENELRFQLAVQGSQDAIWDWDLVSNKIYYSPRWVAMFHEERLIQSDSIDAWVKLIASSEMNNFTNQMERLKLGQVDQIDIEMEMRTAKGDIVYVLCRGAGLKDKNGEVIRLAGSLADVTEQRKTSETLRELAERDGLTGLANRAFFRERVELAVSRSQSDSKFRYVVLYLDFDGFKAVNDALGHNIGDELLISISDRMSETLPASSVIARLGGDEFAILLTESSRVHATSVCDTLLESFQMPHKLESHEIVSTASIGVVLAEERYTNVDDVMRDADAAMYEAKTNGKSQAQFFDLDMHKKAVKRLSVENKLHIADIQQDFKLLYQPLVNLDTGEPEGVEALVRWNVGNSECVNPDVFIPIAEEIGVIQKLGTWILYESGRTLRAWDRELGHSNTIMHVNVSKRQILHPGFISILQEFQIEFPDLHGRIVLEITESAVIDTRANVISLMETIRAMGFPLAMDDFGTGHSSLSCLHQFPLDVLKIDRSFIINLESNREFTAVYHSIVTLAQNFGLSIVAEGLETDGQLAQLQSMGCMFGQGYYFAKPLEKDDALRFLQGGTQTKMAA
jgi:diguanylate cyclase (GGDEF)-like protein/PAS domain S-box-containing protein